LKKICAFENGRNEQNTKNEKVVKSAKNAKNTFVCKNVKKCIFAENIKWFSSGLVAVGSGLKDTGRSGDVSLGTPDVRPRIETSTQAIDP